MDWLFSLNWPNWLLLLFEFGVHVALANLFKWQIKKVFFFSFWQLGFLVAFGNYMKIWRNWLKLNLKLNRCTMYEWECSSSLIRCFVYFCDNCNQKKMAQKHRRTKFFFNIFDNSFAVSDTLLSYCQRRTEVLRVTHEYKFKRIFTLNPWFEVKEK